MKPLRIKITNEGILSLLNMSKDAVIDVIATDTPLNLLLAVLPEHVENSIHPLSLAHRLDEQFVQDLRSSLNFDSVPNLEQYMSRLSWWFHPSHIAVVETSIAAKKTIDGCSCKVCGNFCMMSEPNETDGTFTCYSCRAQPLRRYY